MLNMQAGKQILYRENSRNNGWAWVCNDWMMSQSCEVCLIVEFYSPSKIFNEGLTYVIISCYYVHNIDT